MIESQIQEDFEEDFDDFGKSQTMTISSRMKSRVSLSQGKNKTITDSFPA